MANITIRNLDDAVKQGLRVRAAQHGRSMEEEVRHILRQAIGSVPVSESLGRSIHARFAALGGADLDILERDSARGLPDLE